MNQEIANNLSTFKNSIEDYERAYRNLVKDFNDVVTHMRRQDNTGNDQLYQAGS